MIATSLPGMWLSTGGVQLSPGQLLHRQQSPGPLAGPPPAQIGPRPPLVGGTHAMSSATQALIDLKNLQSHSLPPQMAMSYDKVVRCQSMPVGFVKTEVDPVGMCLFVLGCQYKKPSLFDSYCRPFLLPSFSTAVPFYCRPFLLPSFSTAVLFYCRPFLLPSLSTAGLFYCRPFLLPSFSTAVLGQCWVK